MELLKQFLHLLKIIRFKSGSSTTFFIPACPNYENPALFMVDKESLLTFTKTN